MKVDPLLPEVLAALSSSGLETAEIYLKEGRSRRLGWEGGHTVVHAVREAGWAIRAGDRHCSFFLAATGRPSPAGPWPAPDGYALRLPDAAPVLGWREPAHLDVPLIGEREGEALLDAIAATLGEELPGARLDLALLEDGSSSSQLASSQGVRASWRQRLAAIRLHASWRGASAEIARSAGEARQLAPAALARALADRLLPQAEGAPVARDRADVVLSPALAASLVAGLAPLWLGVGGAALAAVLRDRSGRLAAASLTLVDDARLAGGALAAPVDGEGLPTRAVTLVEEGVYRQPLLAWWEREEGIAGGCMRRAGWRDLPRPGASHLFLRPDRGVAPGRLLAELARGYYLVDATGAGRFALEEDRFAVPVCGFAVRSGRVAGPLAGVWLTGRVSALLHGVQAVGRDLAFLPAAGGMVGSPTLRVSGLELRDHPPTPPVVISDQ